MSPTKTHTSSLRVALIGNPNTGKSTLFNALSGGRARVGNYPGVTVEKKTASVRWPAPDASRIVHCELIDLPGTYSLNPRSPDEMVSLNVLLDREPAAGHIDCVVCVLDASNLDRNLYLATQLLSFHLPLVLVLNMIDVAEKRGISIDAAALGQKLGVPVVVTQGHRRRGLAELRAAISSAVAEGPGVVPEVLPEAFYAQVKALAEEVAPQDIQPAGHPDLRPGPRARQFLIERCLLDVGGQVERELTAIEGAEFLKRVQAARRQLLEAGHRIPAVEAQSRYRWIRELLSDIQQRPVQRVVTASDRVDRFLTHRVFGLVAFIVVMFLVFQSLYTWSGPLMEGVEWLQGAVAGQVQAYLAPGPFRSLVVDGVIAGVGSVLVFLPQIVILFLFIAVLEDCGYMARAAFLMDKLMSRLGLSGKSFVPLMSSFACAIPGIMATRVIENRRDRMVTILIAPLMSCSARLPVYVLMISAFVPATTYLGGWISLQAVVLLAMTSLGAVVAVPVAFLLRKTLFRGETAPFVMELPSYKWPTLGNVVRRVYDRAKSFVTRAGSLIFLTTIVVWAAGYFPGDHRQLNAVQGRLESLERQQRTLELAAAHAGPGGLSPLLVLAHQARVDQEREPLETRQKQLSSQLIAHSLLGRAGRFLEPAFKPLGWDWKIGVGAIASFPAREVIIATLGTIYSLGGDVDGEDEGLIASLRQARWPDGRPVYNLWVAVSLMVFFALCAQCGATLMVIRRETNSWRWPLVTFVYMTGLAYLGALVTYQLGSRLFG